MTVIFIWSFYDKYIVAYITTYNDQIVALLFIKNCDFVRQRLMLFLIVVTGRLLMFLVKVVRLMIVTRGKFLRKAKNIGCWICSFKRHYNLWKIMNICWKYRRKTSYLNLKLGWNKIKLTSRKCYLSVQCRLEPV